MRQPKSLPRFRDSTACLNAYLKSPKITKRAVDAFKPAERERVVWDDDMMGFGVRVHPSGAKAFLVNYRVGNGGRKAPNKRVVVGRAGRVTPDQERDLGIPIGGSPARKVICGGAPPPHHRTVVKRELTLQRNRLVGHPVAECAGCIPAASPKPASGKTLLRTLRRIDAMKANTVSAHVDRVTVDDRRSARHVGMDGR